VTPVELEVARHALAAIAEQMGVALQRSAYSPNIKERVDCSAAVFDPAGAMVAQAEHIPVHLGSMPASVAAAVEAFGGALDPGMQVLLNDPYAGGTHLPDLTLVTAVGDDAGRLLGYVANRAHHADVGGAAPGSMPASATDIAAEGLRIPPTLVGDAQGLRTDVLEIVAANSRTPQERRGDLRAQLAANHVGAARLRDLAAASGPSVCTGRWPRCATTPTGACGRPWRACLTVGGRSPTTSSSTTRRRSAARWRSTATRWRWTSPAPTRRCR